MPEPLLNPDALAAAEHHLTLHLVVPQVLSDRWQTACLNAAKDPEATLVSMLWRVLLKDMQAVQTALAEGREPFGEETMRQETRRMPPLEHHYEQALRMIAEPFTALQQAAEAVGARFNGMMAQQFISDPSYYQAIAREALLQGEAIKQTTRQE